MTFLVRIRFFCPPLSRHSHRRSQARITGGFDPFIQGCSSKTSQTQESKLQYTNKDLGDGQLVQFIACAMDEEAKGSDQWRTVVNADELRQKFQNWPVHLKKAIEEVPNFPHLF